jgi:hypothetical protein
MDCPVCCGNELEGLGVLGSTAWFRCAGCGMDCSHEVSELESYVESETY